MSHPFATTFSAPDTSTTASFLGPTHSIMQMPWLLFRANSFYKHPIIMEEVPDNLFLGMRLHTGTARIQYAQPSPHSMRSTKSAGSTRLRFSGLLSRLSIMNRASWPQQQKIEDAATLLALYKSLGYTHQELKLATLRRPWCVTLLKTLQDPSSRRT